MSEHQVEYNFTYTFVPDDNDAEVEISLTTTTNDRDVVDEQAREKLSQYVESDGWSVRRVSIGFVDAPWSSMEDLMDMIRSLPYVNTVRYESPMEGPYGPPKIHTGLDSGSLSAFKDDVSDIFPALVVEEESLTRATVIVSAIQT